MKKKEKKKMSKKKKIIIFILVLLVAAALVFVALKVGNKGEEKPQKTVVDQIKNFDYSAYFFIGDQYQRFSPVR